MLIHALSALLIGLVVLAGSAHAEPEVFSKAGYEADRAAAVEGEKLHILFFTANWNLPCMHMKKTTWVDQALVSWLNKHAIVTAINIEELRELTDEFGITASPAVVVLDGNLEIGRMLDHQGPEEFLNWLVKVQAGEIENTYVEEQRTERTQVQKLEDLSDRMKNAAGLIENQQYELALKSYLRIWEIILVDGTIAQSCGIENENQNARLLISRYEPALEAFKLLRDREQAKQQAGEVAWDRVASWVILNDILEDYGETIRWIERRLSDGESVGRFTALDKVARRAMLIRKRFDLLEKIYEPSIAADKQMSLYKAYAWSLSMEQSESKLSDEEYQDKIGELSVRAQKALAFYYTIALGVNDEYTSQVIMDYILEINDTPFARQLLNDAAQEAGVDKIEFPR